MRPTLLRTLTRRLEAGAADVAPDAELVRRFAACRDAAAFAALVRRHGPMVWGVCRHLLCDPADADDAFQAVFLALVHGADRLRNPAAVGAWLHGAAVRVAAQAKRSAARRKRREQAAAVPEAETAPVPDAAWEAALAAVHEEVGRLPDDLRAAFVLCDLEGVAPADAAARLGWKPGTLSGRLTRARQHLLGRLARRGLAPAAAVAVACSPAAAPARLVEAVLTFPTNAGAVPAAIGHLASGVSDMTRMKLMAAAVLVAGGLAAGAWARLVPQAGAEPPKVEAKSDKGDAKAQPPRPTDKVDPAKAGQRGNTKPNEAELLSLFLTQILPQDGKPVIQGLPTDGDVLLAEVLTQQIAAKPAAPTWEFKYYAPMPPLTLGAIEAVAAKYAPDGWEYAGCVKLTYLSDDDREVIEAADVAQLKRFVDAMKAGSALMSLDVLVFKRQVKRAAHATALTQLREDQKYRELLILRGQEDLARAADPAEQAKRKQVRDLEAQLADIQKKLADLRDTHKKSCVLTHEQLGPADLGQVMTALVALADARYGEEGRRQRLTFSHGKVGPKHETDGLTITGDPDAVDWVAAIAEKLKPATSDPAKPPAGEKK
jgi:RNA polymerase sigma factor (sigma-70 family)